MEDRADDRIKDIKSIIKDITSINGNRYRIVFLTTRYSPSTVRLAHLVLLKLNAVKRIKRRVYEITDRKLLHKISNYSFDRLKEEITQVFILSNKKANNKNHYRGRNAPIDRIYEVTKND